MADLTVLVSSLASIFSAFAAALAWLAKIRWSSEFAAAKDETIKAKDAQINSIRDQFQETLRAKDAQIEAMKELTPMKVREYFVSVKQQLEEYNEKLKADLEGAQADITKYSQEIQEEKAKAAQNADREALIRQLEQERTDLRKVAETWSNRAKELESENSRLTKLLALLEDMPRAPIPQAQGPSPEPIKPEPPGTLTLQYVKENWSTFLAGVRKYSKIHEALMRDAEPVDVVGNKVEIGFYYRAHLDRFEREPEHKAQVERILAEVLGLPVRIRTVYRKNPQSLISAEDLGSSTLP